MASDEKHDREEDRRYAFSVRHYFAPARCDSNQHKRLHGCFANRSGAAARTRQSDASEPRRRHAPTPKSRASRWHVARARSPAAPAWEAGGEQGKRGEEGDGAGGEGGSRCVRITGRGNENWRHREQ
eukprot:1583668-Pleurochrysis_carterae.AAC.1